MRRVARRVQLDAEEAQALADAGADERRVLADAPGEDERVQPAERGGECADPFPRLVAEQRHGFRRPDVVAFLREQVAHVGTVSDTPSSPDSWFTM